MGYTPCCCKKLDEITSNEIKTLWSTSYQTCVQQQNQMQKSCSSWSWWFRWLCILWTWIVVIFCVLWVTITNVFWSIIGYSSFALCNLFPNVAVWILNNILKNNLSNSISLGFGINTPANPIIKPGWGNPTFNDEFTGNTIDILKWYKGYTDRPNPFSDYDKYISNGTIPREYYDDSAIIVSNGTLRLNIDYDPMQNTQI